MQKKRVAFLLDKTNNWIEKFLLNSSILEDNYEYDLKISFNPLDISNQDIVFILGYTKILNAEFLKSNKLNLVIHESALPHGKGFAPVQWQILEGRTIIRICLIEAKVEVDSCDILYRDQITLTGLELFDEIREKQAIATINVISDFLKIYPNFIREKQTGVESFYPKRKVNDGELNIDKSIRQQFNLLRTGNNNEWPSFFYYEGKKYIIKIYLE